MVRVIWFSRTKITAVKLVRPDPLSWEKWSLGDAYTVAGSRSECSQKLASQLTDAYVVPNTQSSTLLGVHMVGIVKQE